MLTPEQRKRFDREFPELRRSKAPHLTAPSWQYEPYPGRFEAHYCVYCGERARTYDAIPNRLAAVVNGQVMRNYLLVASCAACQGYLNQGEFPDSNMNKRRYAIMLDLRRRYQHSRATKTSTTKLVMQRRINYLLRNMKTGDDRQRVGCRAPKPPFAESRMK